MYRYDENIEIMLSPNVQDWIDNIIEKIRTHHKDDKKDLEKDFKDTLNDVIDMTKEFK